jgi:hypothetical protein
MLREKISQEHVFWTIKVARLVNRNIYYLFKDAERLVAWIGADSTIISLILSYNI